VTIVGLKLHALTNPDYESVFWISKAFFSCTGLTVCSGWGLESHEAEAQAKQVGRSVAVTRVSFGLAGGVEHVLAWAPKRRQKENKTCT
jgi:hypothetical protein